MTLTTAEMRAAIVAQRQGPPKCERCGGPVWTHDQVQALRNALSRAKMRGVQWESVNLPSKCRVCPVNPEDERDSNPIGEARHAHFYGYDDVTPFPATPAEWFDESEKWRGREQEANAWDDPTAHELWGNLDDHGRKYSEYAGRPRAIVEVGPEPGSLAAAEALCHARMQMVGSGGFNDNLDLARRADARVGHTHRDVPAYTEVDRYDPETGVPRCAAMNSSVTNHLAPLVEKWVEMLGASRVADLLR